MAFNPFQAQARMGRTPFEGCLEPVVERRFDGGSGYWPFVVQNKGIIGRYLADVQVPCTE